MLAVNDPLVVLGSAEVRFSSPVRVGDTVVASARVSAEKGKKRVIEVSAQVGDREVLAGTMTAFVLDQYVLDQP
jgi:predicted thioesterase